MLIGLKPAALGAAALALALSLSSAPLQAQGAACPGNPDALGVSRTVEIDTAGGPGFGFEHFRQHDFLRPNEIVLTFDDGPWPKSTQAVLAALAQHCTKAIFFPIGKHATYYPEILREVAKAGHTIGSHTWAHLDLSRQSAEIGRAEIEMGIAAVRRAIGDQAAPIFRFPALRHPPEMVKLLGTRNIAIFSTDVDSFDFKLRSPEKLVSSLMERIEKKGGGKGIVLLHDFQQHTAKALPDLLRQMKAKGLKVVHVRAKGTVQSIPEFDAKVASQLKGPVTDDGRPTSSVVRTVDEEKAKDKKK